MTKLENVSWISEGQRAILAEHNCTTLEQLASLETRDSLADVVPIDNLRKLAKRARQSLGHADPLARIGAASGQRAGTPVAYAGGVRYED